MALDRAPISAGEFIGHRVWEVHKYKGVPTLRSWVYKCFWLPGEVVSDISYEGADAINSGITEDNKCGVWGFKTRELLHDDFSRYTLGYPIVYGTCYMWGTIIEHELGYRAQHARVLGLEFSVEADPAYWSYESSKCACEIDLDFLRKRYGVA